MGFYKEKKCQSCGGDYSGTASSRYCLDCKVDIMEKNKRECIIKWKAKHHENI